MRDFCEAVEKGVFYFRCTLKKGMLMVNERRVQQLRQMEKPRYMRELHRAARSGIDREDLVTDYHALRWLRFLDTENELGRSGRWINYLQ